MEMTVTFRHLEPSDAVKNYAMDKVSRIEKYLSNITEVHIILSQEKRAKMSRFSTEPVLITKSALTNDSVSTTNATGLASSLWVAMRKPWTPATEPSIVPSRG